MCMKDTKPKLKGHGLLSKSMSSHERTREEARRNRSARYSYKLQQQMIQELHKDKKLSKSLSDRDWNSSVNITDVDTTRKKLRDTYLGGIRIQDSLLKSRQKFQHSEDTEQQEQKAPNKEKKQQDKSIEDNQKQQSPLVLTSREKLAQRRLRLAKDEGEGEGLSELDLHWRDKVRRAKRKAQIVIGFMVRLQLAQQKLRKSKESVRRVPSMGVHLRLGLGPELENIAEQQCKIADNIMSTSFTSRISWMDQDQSSEEEQKSEENRSTHLAPENMLNMFVNRVNASWIEQREWDEPHVFTVQNFKRIKDEYEVYLHEARTAILNGQLAYYLVSNGEDVVLPGNQTPLKLAFADPWQLVQHFCPSRLPSGQRMEGISFFARRLIQLSIQVQQFGGATGLSKFPLILYLTKQELDLATKCLKKWDYFSFNPQNIMIVLQAQHGGLYWDIEQSDFQAVEGSKMKSGGSGYGLLQLGWNEQMYQLNGAGEPVLSQTNVLETLAEKEVTWLLHTDVLDIERCTKDAIDMDFMAFTIKLFYELKISMAAEVTFTEQLKIAKSFDSILMREKDAEPGLVSMLRVTDMSTPILYNQLQTLSKQLDGYYAGINRFLFHLNSLKKQLVGPQAFSRPQILLDDLHLYANFDLQDLTPQSQNGRCAAICTNTGEVYGAFSKVDYEWISHFIPLATNQDLSPSFKAMVMNISNDNDTGISIKTKADKYEAKNLNIVVFVCGDDLSKMAFNMARALVHTEEDKVYVMHSIRDALSKYNADKIMEQYQDPSKTIIHDVIVRGEDQLLPVLQQYAQKRKADMVVLGSNALSDTQNQQEGALVIGSMAMSIVKSFDFPILVVKSSASGWAVSGVKPKTAPAYLHEDTIPLKVMLTVEQTSRPLMRFSFRFLDPGTDKLIMARPDAMDSAGRVKPRDRSMIQIFCDEAQANNFQPIERPLDGKKQFCLPEAAWKERVDILALQMPNNKTNFAQSYEVLRKCRCSVLLYPATT